MIQLWRKRIRLWARYTGASVVAGIISEVVFVVTYWFAAAPLAASLLAFVAGAVPNYLMNRYWAWQRRGRPDRTREILPYAVIVVVTARDRDSRHDGRRSLGSRPCRGTRPAGHPRRCRVPGDLRGDVRAEVRALRPVHLRRARSTYSRHHVRTMTRAYCAP